MTTTTDTVAPAAGLNLTTAAALAPDEVLKRLGSSDSALSSQEAAGVMTGADLANDRDLHGAGGPGQDPLLPDAPRTAGGCQLASHRCAAVSAAGPPPGRPVRHSLAGQDFLDLLAAAARGDIVSIPVLVRRLIRIPDEFPYPAQIVRLPVTAVLKALRARSPGP